jgi:integrase
MESQATSGRLTNRLTANGIKKLLATPKMHPDGGGLYLQVQKPGQASWLHRYTRAGRERQMGLGRYPDVSLAEARDSRDANKALLIKGVDPLDARAASATAMECDDGLTFRAAAERYIASHRAEWTNPKHSQQWLNTLSTYVFPIFREKRARDVTRDDVLAVLNPIWNSHTETAKRVRGRIEAVLSAVEVNEDWAGWKNPADWRRLKHDLAAPSKVAPVKHHPAVPVSEAPAIMAKLRAAKGVGTLALQFCILTAARSEMVMGARWTEIDVAGAIWLVPTLRDGKGSGLKGQASMRVPLSPAAMAVLDAVRPLRRQDGGDFLFPGTKPGKAISNATMMKALRAAITDVTVHGWRSTFRDWAGEITHYAADVIEAALNHQLPGGEVRSAYQRGDLFIKRKALMTEWATFLGA